MAHYILGAIFRKKKLPNDFPQKFFSKFSSSQFLKCHPETETCFQKPLVFQFNQKMKGSFFSLFRVVLTVPGKAVTPTSHLWTDRDLHFTLEIPRTQNLLALTQPMTLAPLTFHSPCQRQPPDPPAASAPPTEPGGLGPGSV